MEGLLAEGKEMMEEYKNDPALDAVLIATAQKVEHYEIASMEPFVRGRSKWTMAKHWTCSGPVSKKREADEKLTKIAETAANLQAEEQE
jgi:ferritin-like metal-binding protein YciE